MELIFMTNMTTATYSEFVHEINSRNDLYNIFKHKIVSTNGTAYKIIRGVLEIPSKPLKTFESAA